MCVLILRVNFCLFERIQLVKYCNHRCSLRLLERRAFSKGRERKKKKSKVAFGLGMRRYSGVDTRRFRNRTLCTTFFVRSFKVILLVCTIRCSNGLEIVYTPSEAPFYVIFGKVRWETNCRCINERICELINRQGYWLVDQGEHRDPLFEIAPIFFAEIVTHRIRIIFSMLYTFAVFAFLSRRRPWIRLEKKICTKEPLERSPRRTAVDEVCAVSMNKRELEFPAFVNQLTPKNVEFLINFLFLDFRNILAQRKLNSFDA